MDLLKFPAVVFCAPDSQSGVLNLSAILQKWNISSFFVRDDPGMNAFVFIEHLRKSGFSPEFGLCVNYRDKNGLAIMSDLLTARELGVRHIYLRESDYSAAAAVSPESTVSVISKARAAHGDFFRIMVQNCFLHKNDLVLLKKQMAAGADLVACDINGPGAVGRDEYKDKLIGSLRVSKKNAADTAQIKGKNILIDIACHKVDIDLASKFFE